jgi:hypothetical protein
MRKTLLLVFIHGFKVCCLPYPAHASQLTTRVSQLFQGGDDTFGTFPEHLRALLSHALPKLDVLAVQYPKFETKGELKDCVERLREW